MGQCKKSGYLFIASGIAFFAAAILAEQETFFVLSASFIILGTISIKKAIE
ncbi:MULTISPECIES: hypothetical protein [Pseudoalteromonas]|uniref:hypothetical protein n=1 Tax=Pseudoalteromonas TaxID=53246 RepID=UPI0013FD4B03|nr:MULTISPECIES: hypothetical protein [Pseudoalteromonas]MBH0032049.1 hypothetical protein [Pseudoalteromonas sp. SWYJZ98]QQM63256.1 hypothetical protein JG479_10990 [Pseudoalteromonas sp. LC2018020214]